jgi:hypothetical protein
MSNLPLSRQDLPIEISTVVEGYLYIAEEVYTGYIKIGYTRNLARRLEQLEKTFHKIFLPRFRLDISAEDTFQNKVWVRLITFVPATPEVEEFVHLFLRSEESSHEWYLPSLKVYAVIDLIKLLSKLGCVLCITQKAKGDL